MMTFSYLRNPSINCYTFAQRGKIQGQLDVHKDNSINTDKNFVSVDLSTGTTTQTNYDVTQEQIETSAQILANILLDYVKQNGTTILSPENVFGKGERNE